DDPRPRRPGRHRRLHCLCVSQRDFGEAERRPTSAGWLCVRSEMASNFRTLDSADLSGKRVLVRVDLNVPMENGKVTDATRIERVAPTITEIAGKGGKVILLAHFGRPKGRDPKESLKPVAAELGHVLKRHVAF